MTESHDTSQRPGERPGGRPRDPHIDAAVLTAALKVMDEVGYINVSLEEVARRAGTSRPAIYRRWSGRADLVLAAIGSRLALPAPPDTGCTLCDIGDSFNVFLAAYRTISPDAFNALYSECVREPWLQVRYRETVIEPSRDAVRTTLRRAIGRGDLRTEVDVEQILDIIASLVHYRVLFGQHLSDADADQIIETLLRGVAVDYPALLAHSKEVDPEHFDSAGAHHLPLTEPDSPVGYPQISAGSAT